MRRVQVTVIGAGQVGLAASRQLTTSGIEHVVLERARVAEAWRHRGPDLRLLTPNWMTRLPGWRHHGPEPQGFMTAPEVAGFLEDYAARIQAPLHTGVHVVSVRRGHGRFTVAADGAETLLTDAVVIATGHAQAPRVPAFAPDLDPRVQQVTAADWRRGLRPEGAVLVAGAGASGVQVAADARAAGREVVLAVGSHTRLPRTHQGEDIYCWLDHIGALEGCAGPRARPSAQLVGSPDGQVVDLVALRRSGVHLTGRLSGAAGSTVRLQPDLAEVAGAADQRLARLLRRIDLATGTTCRHGPAFPRLGPVRTPTRLDLRALGIRTVVWATGHRRAYPWLDVPGVLDQHGEIRQRGGFTPVPALYALGLARWNRHDATLLDGAGAQARRVVDDLVRRLRRAA